MNSFGLGLVLNFTDNASAGMASATNMFNQMSFAAASLESSSAGGLIAAQTLGGMMVRTGNDFINAGTGILKSFVTLSQKVVSTGSDFESFRITLNALYGDADVAAQKLNQLIDFAARTPFEVADVKNLLVTLKTQGIDAFEQMTGSTSGLKQETLAWIGDLMTFKPEVPMSRWKLALQNYIGSGESKVLRNVLDMGNIEDVLGHGIGETTQERMNDIVEIVEKANLGGLMNSMFGTWQQTLSNFQDQITKLFLAIADSGAYDTLKEILTYFTSILSSLSDEELNALAQTLADAFNMVLVPVKALASAIADAVKWFIDLASNYPVIAKFVAVFSLIAASLLLITGFMSKFVGSILIVSSSIKILGGLSVIVNSVKAAILGVSTVAAPLIGIAIAIFFAWKNNLFGIRDLVSRIFGEIYNVVSITWDALADNTLSEEQFLKARDLGILPFIESVLNLKYEVGKFIDGFKEGLQSVRDFIQNLFPSLGDLDISIYGIVQNIGKFIDKFTGAESTSVWETIGKLAGIFIGIVVPLSVIVRLFSTLFSVVSLIGGVLIPVISGIAAFLASPIGFVTVVIAAIVGIIALIYKYRDSIVQFFTSLKDAAVEKFNDIKEAVSNKFAEIRDAIGEKINSVIDFFTNLKDSIRSKFEEIGEAIMNSRGVQMLSSFADAAAGTFQSFLGVVKSGVGVIGQIFSSSVQVLKSVVYAAYEFVRAVFLSILAFFKLIFMGIYNFFKDKIDQMNQAWSSFYNAHIKPILDAIKNKASEIWNKVTEIVGNFVTAASEKWNSFKSAVSSIFDAIKSKASEVWNGIKNTFLVVYDWLHEKVIAIKGYFTETFDNIADRVSEAFDSIKVIAQAALGWIEDKLNALKEGISWIGDKLSSGFTSAGNFFKGIGDKAANFIGLDTGGYVKKEGLAALHPNEVVVNGPMTKALGNFLNDYTSGIQTVPNNVTPPSYGAISEQDEIYFDMPSAESNPLVYGSTGYSPSYDNHTVTFESGSIVIQVQGTTDNDLNSLADRIMKIAQRKMQLQNMATRKA